MRQSLGDGRAGGLLHLLRARLRAMQAAATPAAATTLPAPLLPHPIRTMTTFSAASRGRRATAITTAAVTGVAAGARGAAPRERQLRLALRHAAPGLSPGAAAAVLTGSGRWPSLAQDALGLAARCAALQRLLGPARAESLLRRHPDVLTRAPAALEAQLERAAAALEGGGGAGGGGRPETAADAAAAAAAAASATTTTASSKEAAVRLLTTAPQLMMLPPERLEHRLARLAELLALPLPLPPRPPPGEGGGGSWPRRLLALPMPLPGAGVGAAGAGWAVLPLGALAALTRALTTELGLANARGSGVGVGSGGAEESSGGGSGGPSPPNADPPTVAELVLREPRLAELAVGAASPGEVEASVRERLDALRQMLVVVGGGGGGSGGEGASSAAHAAKFAAFDAAVRRAARAHPSLLVLAPSEAQRRLRRLVGALPEVWAAGVVRPRVAESAGAAAAAAGAAGAALRRGPLDAAAGRCGPLAVDADALAASPALAALIVAPELDVSRVERWDHRHGGGDDGGAAVVGSGAGRGSGIGSGSGNNSSSSSALGARLDTVAWQVLRLHNPQQWRVGEQHSDHDGGGGGGGDCHHRHRHDDDAAHGAWVAARGVARRAPAEWGWAREFERDLRGPGGAFERWAAGLEAREDGWARGAWAWAALPSPPSSASDDASGIGGSGGTSAPLPPPFALADLPALPESEFDARAARSGLPSLRDAVAPPTRDLPPGQMAALLASAASGDEAPLSAALARHRALWARVGRASARGPPGWDEELRQWRAHLDAALLPSPGKGGAGAAGACRAGGAAADADVLRARRERRHAFWAMLERDLEPRLQRLRFLRQVADLGDDGGPPPDAADAAAAAATAGTCAATCAAAAAAAAASQSLWAALAATDRQFTRAHGPWRYGAWRRLSALVAPARPWARELAALRGADLDRLLRLASGPRGRRLEYLLHAIDPALGPLLDAAAAARADEEDEDEDEDDGENSAAEGEREDDGGGGGGDGRAWFGAPPPPPPPPPGDEWRAVGLSEALEADDAAFEAAFPDSRFMAWRALAEMAGILPLTTTMLPPLPVWPPPPPPPAPAPPAAVATPTAAAAAATGFSSHSSASSGQQQQQQHQYFYYFADRDEEDDEHEEEALALQAKEEEEAGEGGGGDDANDANADDDDDDMDDAHHHDTSPETTRRLRGRPRRANVMPFLPASSAALATRGTDSAAAAAAAAAASLVNAAALARQPTRARVAELTDRAHRVVELVGRCPAWESEARGLGVPAWRLALHYFSAAVREPRFNYLLATGLAGPKAARGGPPAPAVSLIAALKAPERAFYEAHPGFAAWRLLAAAAAPVPPWRAELEEMAPADLRALLDDVVAGAGGSAGDASGAGAGAGVAAAAAPRGGGEGRSTTTAAVDDGGASPPAGAAAAAAAMAPMLAALRERLRHYSLYRRWTKTSLADVARGTAEEEEEEDAAASAAVQRLMAAAKATAKKKKNKAAKTVAPGPKRGEPPRPAPPPPRRKTA